MNFMKHGISGSSLKIIAMISMLIDHIGAILVEPLLKQAEFGSGNLEILYFSMRTIGRLAFPIFCFLLVEGFLYTRNVNRYIFRLFLFSLLSEIPFNLALEKTIFYPAYQNVFFTLLIGLFVLIGLQKFKQKSFLSICVVMGGCGLAYLLKTDYSFIGILLIVVLYQLHNNKKQQLLYTALFSLILGNLFIIVAYVLLYFYNGKRGLSLKYVFYCFYPVHLLLLYGISYLT